MAVPGLIASNGRYLDAALFERVTEVRVEQFASEPTSYSIRFADDIEDGQPVVADAESLQVGRMLTIVVTTDDGDECLVHGQVEQHKVSFAAGGAGSWIEVRGRDRRSEMSRACVTEVWKKTSVSAILQSVLARHGFGTDVPTSGSAAASRLIFHQRDTDLSFVDELVERFGLELWLDVQAHATALGVTVKETARVREAAPRSAALSTVAARPARLQMNRSSGEATMSSFVVDIDVDRPALSKGVGYDDREGRVERFSLEGPGGTLARHFRAEVCVVGAGSAANLRVRSEAHLREASWFVQAAASTTTALLGRALAPHQRVSVEGVGKTHSGDYEVQEVVHVLTPASHTMDLSLRRSWLGN